MTNPGQLALINAEIDGELDGAQRAELARALLADPGARQLRDDLRRLCQTLDAVPQVEPPSGLRESILAAMPQRVTPLRPSRGFVARPAITAWRYAALFAGVLLAGTVMFELVRNPAPEPREIVGTIAPDPTAMLIDTAQVASPLVSGNVSLYRDRAALTLRFDVEARTPVDARVTSEGHSFHIVGINRTAASETGGFAPGTPVAAPLPGVAMHGQTINVTLTSGGHPVGTAVLRAPHGN